MGFLGSLLSGVTGFLTGGPVGAALGLAGSAGGGGNSRPAASTVSTQPVVDVGQMEQMDPVGMAYIQGFLSEASKYQQKPTTFNANAGQGQSTAPMQQSSNQRGGMSGFNGMGLLQERKGPGYGGGTGDGSALGGVSERDQAWNQLIASVIGRNQNAYTAGMAPQFQSYMQSALAGQEGLPMEAYNRALLQGQQTINAQAQQARASLEQNMGSRGLLHSGLMAGGLQGVEQQRLGSIGGLVGTLATQGLEARREAQRQAAAMLPSLIGAQSSAMGNTVQGYLAMRQLELQGQSQALYGKQVEAQGANQWLDLLGGLGAAYYQSRNPLQGGTAYQNKTNKF